MDTPERSVWVFLGEHARWPSGIFTSREAAVQWIAEHRLTGMITEYPLDVGIYDWAVARGAFRPGKQKHLEPEFVGNKPPRARPVLGVDCEMSDLPGNRVDYYAAYLTAGSIGAPGVGADPERHHLGHLLVSLDLGKLRRKHPSELPGREWLHLAGHSLGQW